MLCILVNVRFLYFMSVLRATYVFYAQIVCKLHAS